MRKSSMLPAAVALVLAQSLAAEDDPFLWLEEIEGERALAWVAEQNARSTAELEADPRFTKNFERVLAILDSDARIPAINQIGAKVYNFWRDAANPRGLWRRTTLEGYRSADTAWETVLDLDALAAAEGENWVWSGANCHWPEQRRCLISLSRGGADATVIREFDLVDRAFVEGGFALEEAKGGLAWRDLDTVYVSRVLGPDSETASGYARQIREWSRGTPIESAPVIFEGELQDISVAAITVRDSDRELDLIRRGLTFFTAEWYLRGEDGWQRLDLPVDVIPRSFLHGRMLVELRSDWTLDEQTHPQGSLVALDLERWLAGERSLVRLFTPTERSALAGVTTTRDHVLLNVLENVRNRLYRLTPPPAEAAPGSAWQRELHATPGFGTLAVAALDPRASNAYLLTVTDFLTPSTLFLGYSDRPGQHERLRGLPAFFDAEGLVIEQFEARSADGTLIPYFQVSREDLALDGSHPTVIGAYGGFQVSRLPTYNAAIGAAWLEHGGVYVLANIRGGGEFGPRWHQAGRRENRQRVFDDMIAVAEHLIERGVTRPERLGAIGGSNGGLLMGVMQVQRPDLWGALVNQVPLLDMRRYHLLLAGASWVDEYGNPDDPNDWAFISKYSPYQNLSPDAEYPRVLLTTSTRDDRVHPGHARKFAARMAEQGHDFLYWENVEGGHGGAANNRQQAYMTALAWTFFARELGLGDAKR